MVGLWEGADGVVFELGGFPDGFSSTFLMVFGEATRTFERCRRCCLFRSSGRGAVSAFQVMWGERIRLWKKGLTGRRSGRCRGTSSWDCIVAIRAVGRSSGRSSGRRRKGGAGQLVGR